MTIPILTDVGDMSEWLRKRGVKPTADELQTALARVGRNSGPGLLSDLFYARLLTREVLAACVGDAWSDAEYPEDLLDREIWLDLFNAAGYTVDGKPARRPRKTKRLYRGAPEYLSERMAWTTDLEQAKTFADGGLRGRRQGVVWTAEVEPWRLLCALLDAEMGRGEAEYVIDPEDLDIELWVSGGAL